MLTHTPPHARTVMQRALGHNLTALYAPEHGIDGTVGAGIHVSTRRDSVTGLTVYSLYGPTRKPTPAMLAPIDRMFGVARRSSVGNTGASSSGLTITGGGAADARASSPASVSAREISARRRAAPG